jgi:hypothetical protein
MSGLGKIRRSLYRGGSMLGDISAVASGDPKRVMRRAANKVLGKSVIRKAWFR